MSFISRCNYFILISLIKPSYQFLETEDNADSGLSFPKIIVRNETNPDTIYSSTFKRVFVGAAVWNPDSECLFKPRFE